MFGAAMLRRTAPGLARAAGRLGRGSSRPAPSLPHAPAPSGERVLVAGWFSWSDMHATAGDLMARDVACRWLDAAGRRYDVANAPAFGPGVDWRVADPERYAEVLWVCGPVGRNPALFALLERFAGSLRVGLGVTMLDAPADWNPFDVLLERDGHRAARPDLSFAATEPVVPLIGVVLVEPHPPLYPGRDRQAAARAAVELLLSAGPGAPVAIDTRLDVNQAGYRTAAQVESVIARMDVVVTTRLHGLVLALKNGIPAIAIDSVAGGSKLTRQAAEVGWPLARAADDWTPEALAGALRFCLTEEARTLAASCAERACHRLAAVRAELVDAMRAGPG